MADLDKYIETNVVLPVKDFIPVLNKVIGRNSHQSGNIVADPNKKPTPDTIIYKIEFLDERV